MSFASIPLTVHYLGPERYGVWLVISSLLTWMALSDFGLAGNALVNVISEAHGKDDQSLARQYAASAFWALTTIGALLGLALLITFHLIPWRSVFNVSNVVSTQELERTCALTLVIFVLSLPVSMITSVFSAYQDGFVSHLWAIISNLLALISLVIVSRVHGGLPLLVVALSGTRLAVVMASGVYAFFYRYPWLKPTIAAVRWTCLRRLFKLGGKYLVTQLAALGIYQSQPIIITQMLGPAYVTIFVITYKVMSLPIDISYMLTAPFISAYGEARSRGEWSWIGNAYKSSSKLAILSCVPLAALIVIALKPFLRIWAGPATVPENGLIVGLSIYVLISVAMMSAGQMMSGLERLNQLALSTVLCSIVIIGLAILFAPWWGLTGIAVAMALSKLVTFLPIQIMETRRVLALSAEKAAEPAECQLAL